MTIAYALGAPRGPCHNSCDMCTISLGIPLEEFGIEYIDKFKDDREMAITSARLQDYRAIYSSLTMCVFANPKPSTIAELIQTAMGIECNIEKLKVMGERIYMIKRLFNLKMGLKPSDDRLPKILLKPLKKSEAAGKSPDFQKLKRLYYEYRDFNLETGKINQEKLNILGLDNL
ncbi:MAG: aldehyde ferredoxin oxidoreductase C-terminal domain-containing protein, partial [Promethearchaeota archaeon]